MLPLSQPVLAALAIFAFRSAWNDFLWPLIAVNKADMFPLPVALALLRGAYAAESYGPIMAGAALSALPLLVVFAIANRRIVEGVRLVRDEGLTRRRAHGASAPRPRKARPSASADRATEATASSGS